VARKKGAAVHIQAWFNLEGEEKGATDTIEYLRKNYQLSDKAIVYYALAALSQRDFPELVTSIPTQENVIGQKAMSAFDKLLAIIDRFADMPMDGQVSIVAREIADSAHEMRTDLSLLEQNVAARYHPISFDDDEEEN